MKITKLNLFLVVGALFVSFVLQTKASYLAEYTGKCNVLYSSSDNKSDVCSSNNTSLTDLLCSSGSARKVTITGKCNSIIGSRVNCYDELCTSGKDCQAGILECESTRNTVCCYVDLNSISVAGGEVEEKTKEEIIASISCPAVSELGPALRGYATKDGLDAVIGEDGYCKSSYVPTSCVSGGGSVCSIGDDSYCCKTSVIEDYDSLLEATESNQGCKNAGEDEDACASCMYTDYDETTGRGTPTGAIWTAIGCIDPSPSGLITRLYQIGVGIVGGLLLLIRVPQIVIAFNSNQPEKKQEAQAGIWSVAGGLLLLLFASAILEALGLHVLGLPRGFI